MDQRDRVVGEQGVGAPGQGEVVTQVIAGVVGIHAGHVIADGSALVEPGEDAEFHFPPQGGLPDQDRGERRSGIEIVVGQHPYGVKLVVVEQVGLVEHEHTSMTSTAVVQDAAADCGQQDRDIA